MFDFHSKLFFLSVQIETECVYSMQIAWNLCTYANHLIEGGKKWQMYDDVAVVDFEFHQVAKNKTIFQSSLLFVHKWSLSLLTAPTLWFDFSKENILYNFYRIYLSRAEIS